MPPVRPATQTRQASLGGVCVVGEGRTGTGTSTSCSRRRCLPNPNAKQAPRPHVHDEGAYPTLTLTRHRHLERMFTTKVRSKKASSCHDARSSAAPDVRSCSTAAPRIRAVVGSERGRHESGRTHAERRITNRALSARDAAIQFAPSWRGMSRSLRTVPKRVVTRFARYLPPLRLLLPTKCSFANTCTPGAASLERAGALPVALCFPPCPRLLSRPTHHHQNPPAPCRRKPRPPPAPRPAPTAANAEVSARAPSSRWQALRDRPWARWSPSCSTRCWATRRCAPHARGHPPLQKPARPPLGPCLRPPPSY